MFCTRQDMLEVIEVEETLNEDSEEGEAILEVAKSIDLTKITLANLMIKSKGELIGQVKMGNHRHVIIVDPYTTI